MGALVFSLISALATLSGGLLPIHTRVRDIGSRYLLGFAAGAMLSVALLAMLPELGEKGQINFLAVAVGFFSLYIVEKLILIHSCPEGQCEFHTLAWTSLIGIVAESLLDGVAIAMGFSILGTAAGVTIALAVVIHEFPRGFATGVIMKAAGYRLGKVYLALAMDALFAPVGVVLVLLGLFPEGLFRTVLAFTVGTFLYVGAADLLPEAHRRFNIWVVASVMIGVLLVPALETFTHF